MTHDESARDCYEENQKLKEENTRLRRIAKTLIAEMCDEQRCERCFGRDSGAEDCVEKELSCLIERFKEYD